MEKKKNVVEIFSIEICVFKIKIWKNFKIVIGRTQLALIIIEAQDDSIE